MKLPKYLHFDLFGFAYGKNFADIPNNWSVYILHIFGPHNGGVLMVKEQKTSFNTTRYINGLHFVLMIFSIHSRCTMKDGVCDEYKTNMG